MSDKQIDDRCNGCPLLAGLKLALEVDKQIKKSPKKVIKCKAILKVVK